MMTYTSHLPSEFCSNGMRFLILALVMTASNSFAQEFKEEQLTQGKAGTEVGQALVVGLGAEHSPKLADGEEVQLVSVSFASGGEDVGDGPISVAIIRSEACDFNGDPNGSTLLNPSKPGVLAVSDNQINPSGLRYGDSLEFTFENDVITQIGESLNAVFVNIDQHGNLMPRPTSVIYAEYMQTAEGDWVPKTNYGEPDNLKAAALSSDQNGDGWLEPARDGADICFEIKFSSQGVDPEPE